MRYFAEMGKERVDIGKWSKAGVPHKGWRWVDTYDRGHDNLEACEMCEQAEVRYVHVMDHPAYGQLNVGCICAGHMEEDLVGAEAREARVRNRSKRRENWLKRKAWKESAKGNPTIRVEGYRVTVFRNGARWKWVIAKPQLTSVFEGNQLVQKDIGFSEFSPDTYASVDEAALGAFDRFEALMGKV